MLMNTANAPTKGFPVLMLDSNAFIHWEGRKFDLIAYLRSRASDAVGVSSIVWQELWFGAEHFEPARSAKRRRFLTSIYPFIKVIPFDVSQAREAAALDARLKSAGTQIGYADTLIAAAVTCCNAELLTFNREEFERTGISLARI